MLEHYNTSSKREKEKSAFFLVLPTVGNKIWALISDLDLFCSPYLLKKNMLIVHD